MLSAVAFLLQEESDEEEEAPKAAPKRKADKQKVEAEVRLWTAAGSPHHHNCAPLGCRTSSSPTAVSSAPKVSGAPHALMPHASALCAHASKRSWRPHLTSL